MNDMRIGAQFQLDRKLPVDFFLPNPEFYLFELFDEQMYVWHGHELSR